MVLGASFRVLTLAVFVGAAACSSEEPLNPPQGCQDFIDAWCNKNAACRAASDRARYREDCEFATKLDVDCSQIEALGPTYDACMATIEQSTCAAYVEDKGLPFPGTCKGILVK